MDDSNFGPIVIGKLLNIGGMLQRKANQLLLPFSLNQQQFSILFEVWNAGRVNQKSVVNRLALEKAHVSKIMKKLREMGLIDITVSSGDRRSSWVSITPKGIETVKECRKIIHAWNSEWVGEIDDDRRSAMLDDLSLLQKVFRENIRNE